MTKLTVLTLRITPTHQDQDCKNKIWGFYNGIRVGAAGSPKAREAASTLEPAFLSEASKWVIFKELRQSRCHNKGVMI